jgi:hypothetical protein
MKRIIIGIEAAEQDANKHKAVEKRAEKEAAEQV